MNLLHNRLCKSARWFETVEHHLLPWALDGVALGPRLLEIGPGFGATTRVLARGTHDITVVEVNPGLADRLRGNVPGNVTVLEGDGAAMPLPATGFDSVVCFTMLHHVPSAAQQDRLFAEARRVLAPGGVFAGSDSLPTPRFRLLHIGDVMVPLDPATLPQRLERAGFTGIAVEVRSNRLRFRATAG
ncbi:class I SAM-dependent methyltransferase [Dactylosporangium vinaceum]|uniref:Class I SAM-dependent methyltransferase n=1 Tax=Dactylosporangium vinaceum TaxID=53362 RepID=A0ABV5M5Q0_9ACTN|nr:class I SAM-dependent methyltransferase [Dactylosporangium vinaceum]UAC01292.1 class I SAM-dependent methyltransferase [Dactylosporangium vinaceum]